MSFLSRRPSRSGNREGDAGRDDEYDDYDYAPDGYRGDEDENWSPGEYFSPEGIKGRWADGQRPGERPAARGRRGDSGRGDPGRGDAGRGDRGRDDYARGDSGPGTRTGPDAAGYDDDGYNGYGPGGGYGTDEYATGAYDLPEGADEERGERGGRRRKERGERGSRLRIGRRDRGEEIWPDDGVSDEDYWASVASDRPLTGGHQPLEAELPSAADSRPTGRPAAGEAAKTCAAAAGSRPGADPRATGDQRFATTALRRRAARRDRPPRAAARPGRRLPAGRAATTARRGRCQLGPGRQRADGGLRAVRRRAPGDRADGGPAGHRTDERLVEPGRVHAVGDRAAAVLPARQRRGGRPVGRRAAARPRRPTGASGPSGSTESTRPATRSLGRTAAARHPAVRPDRPPARHPTRSAPRPHRARPAAARIDS